MEKDYEKLFAVKYVLQKEGLENFRRNRKHITEFENVFFEVVSKEPRPIRKYKISSPRNSSKIQLCIKKTRLSARTRICFITTNM